MPAWFQILTGVFSIVSVLFTIGSAITVPLYRKLKNNITTKNIVITYSAEAPQILNSHPRPVVIAKIGFNNKTNKLVNITQMELVDGKTIIPMNDTKKALNILISPNGCFTTDLAFVIPSPPKYVMSPTCKLRLKANDVILEYNVLTNSSAAPY